MARFAVLHQNIASRARLYGGRWQPALPLANLLDQDLGRIARSVTVQPADTQFILDLGFSQTIGGVAVGPTNITPGAQYEIDASDTPDFQVANSLTGRVTMPGGRVDPMTLGWFHPGFWSGRADPDEDAPWPAHLIALPDGNETVAGEGRYLRIRIFDERNRDGHIDLGFIAVAKVFRPSINFAPDNNGLTFSAVTQVVESKAGNRRAYRYAHRRALQVGWPMLPHDEAFAGAFDMVSRAGVDRVVFVVPDLGDGDHLAARSFFATFRNMSNWQIVNAFARDGKNMVGFGLEFEEHL